MRHKKRHRTGLPIPGRTPFFETQEDPRNTDAVQCTIVNEAADYVRQETPKSLGAYYTDSQVAEFLVRWAIQNGSDTILDPAFGGGVFLRAACKRLRDLGGNPSLQVFGVELDGGVH